MRQLTAGDGYMASNERSLTIGLGTHSQVDRVEMRWPSGAVSELPTMDADREFVVIEGATRANELHRDQ
jgi:hypothetical protein